MWGSPHLQSLERGRAGGGGSWGGEADESWGENGWHFSIFIKDFAPQRIGLYSKGRLCFHEEIDRPTYMAERMQPLGDVYEIVRGGGANRKERFELGVLAEGRTEAIRSPQ